MKQTLSYYQRNKNRIKRKARQTRLTTTGGVSWKNLKKRPYTGACELCGATKNVKGSEIRLEYHHWSDHHPSIGIWLCYPCHRFVELLDKPNAAVLINIYNSIKNDAYRHFNEIITV